MAKQQAPKRTTKTSAAQASDAPRPRRTATKKAAQAASPVLSHSDIATRAYYRFVERGGIPGFEVEDWLNAEADLLKGLK
jgi:Protein of unknown function (DUF2934)